MRFEALGLWQRALVTQNDATRFQGVPRGDFGDHECFHPPAEAGRAPVASASA
jgi:hypothetical protein